MRCTILCRPRLSQEPRPPSAGQIGEHDTIDAKRNALVVIGVQNYFVAEDFPLEVPVAREIVLNINRLATAMRNVGGLVAWVQTTATGGRGTFHSRSSLDRSCIADWNSPTLPTSKPASRRSFHNQSDMCQAVTAQLNARHSFG
jgi:nicotinamidase-related amidase